MEYMQCVIVSHATIMTPDINYEYSLVVTGNES